MTTPLRVGVIGAGAMGGGVVASLRRAGFATHVRDIRPQAVAAAAAPGAQAHDSAAALAASRRNVGIYRRDYNRDRLCLFQ